MSGGIDSSLVASAAGRASDSPVRTFNVRFADPAYDETDAAVAVADSLQTAHQTLDFADSVPSWDEVARLLTAAGQPFADTSIFAVNAICRLMRDRVTVVLSGDGGDEGFGGYNFFGRLTPFAAAQRFPAPIQRSSWKVAALVGQSMARLQVLPSTLPGRLRDGAGATDPAGALECLCSWIRPAELGRLWQGGEVDPVRRLYEPQWEHTHAKEAGRLERLSSLATEIATRLRLANDYLTKVDTASMLTSLEVRVPMLDEDLFAFGLTLPHRLKHHAHTGKQVLRAVARDRLPAAVLDLPKHGFGVPVDTWVDAAFKDRLREELLAPDNRLGDLLSAEEYGPWVRAFCSDRQDPRFTREGLYQRVFMLLSLHLALNR